MKENSVLISAKNIEESNPISTSKESNESKNCLLDFLKTIFSFKSSYTELKESKIIQINIVNSKLNTVENIQPNKYLSQTDISKINEIFEKYKNSPLPLSISLNKGIKSPKPLFPENLNFLNSNNNYSNNTNINGKLYSQNIDRNLFFENFHLKKDNLKLAFFDDISGNINFPILDDDLNLENLFLKQKRKKPDHELKKSFVFISNNKNKKNGTNLNIEKDESEKKNKKKIFRLSKGDRGKNKYRNLKDINKIKKQPGRKKKGSGEYGTHNKFSKDNMMRKLKNKVMESARKLINKMIKYEGGYEYKNLGEIRKIEGSFSQELNIKFNFWFYFRQLKEIFQFNMSTKYSKGDLNSNHRLINKIYSNEKRYKFPKTMKLLEMKFHEYYHYIFLGEIKNWYMHFDIKEKDNKYQLHYFLNYGVPKNDKDYIKYRDTLFSLACKYELFFLKKNPRLSGNKNKDESESHAKKIIKYISPEEFEAYKYEFIIKGAQYVPEIESLYSKYINDYKKKKLFLNQWHLKSNNININKEINEKNKKELNNYENFKENEKINEIINNNIINRIIYKNNENNNNNRNYLSGNKNTQQNLNKHNLFDVSKKLLFEITKKKNKDTKDNKDNNNNGIIKNSLIPKNNNNKPSLNDNISDKNDSKDNSKKKLEKIIQTENNLNQEESIQDIEILL